MGTSFEEARELSLKYFNGDELAADVFLKKYSHVINDNMYLETIPEDMHKRMTREFSRIELSYPNPMSEKEIFSLFHNFSYIIPQGSIMASLGKDEMYGSLSNCIVLPPVFDSYSGIFWSDQQLAQVFKRRCGAGIDISFLRPSSTVVHNAAKTSTGAVSFMERFSNTCREVAQESRRGALMLTIDICHPESEQFALIKQDLRRVTGANISIRISDTFMKSVEDDTDFWLQYPVNVPLEKAEIKKKVRGRDLWKTIVTCAHNTAEPGLLFWDRINEYSPSHFYPGFENTSVNPCVSGDTTLLLRYLGETPIKDVVDQEIVVWNGYEWSTVTPFSTGVHPLLEIEFSNRSILRCTFDHKFLIDNPTEKSKTETRIQAEDLEIGMCLSRWMFPTRNVISEEITIVNITDLHKEEETFCVTESKRHTCLFNRIMTGQCGEIPMGGNGDSCRLIVANPLSCVRDPFSGKAQFDFPLWSQIVYKGQRLNDDLVDLELESIQRILQKVKNDPEPDYIKQCEQQTWEGLYESGYLGRRTGLGFTALGDTIAALGMKYDSMAALEFVEKFMKEKCRAEWESSLDMAKERGAFPAWDFQYDKPSSFIEMLRNEFPEIYKRNKMYGRRNISLSTVAPTGSLSILTQTSSGIEPVYELSYTRRRKLQNSKDEKTDFVDIVGDKWQEYSVNHLALQRWLDLNPTKTLENSPFFGSTAKEINWRRRIDLQSIVQKYTTHSISSTLNLPKNVTVQEVQDLYFYAWKNGLKGVTIYRDGCRDGVLISNNEKQEFVRFNDHHAPKRPDILEAKAMVFLNEEDDNSQWIGVIGLLDNKPYEIFAGPYYENTKFDLYESLTIEKRKKDEKNKYYLCQDNVEVDLGYVSRKEFGNYQRLLSGILRHGMPLSYVLSVVENLTTEKASLFSWKMGIVRLLKQFIKDGTLTKTSCPECSFNLVYENGCKFCPSCGYSKCE